jgi:hypothetical protein
MSENEKQESKFAPSNWKDKLGGSANILKITTGSAWRYISRLMGVFLLGLIVNIIFFVFLQNKIDYQLGKGGGGSLLAIGAITFLFVAFPAAYFFIGHKQALQSVIYYIGNHFKKGIFEYFIDKLFDFAYKKPAIKAQLENDKTDDFFSTTVPEYLERLENMNGTLKRAFKKFTGNIDILGLFSSAQTELGGSLNLDNLKNYVSEKAAEKIPIPMLSKPSWAWTIAVMFVNILFFAACLIFLA